MIKSSFYINLAKCCKYTDDAVDWYLKKFKFKNKSPERQICELKQQIYKRQAMKHLRYATKEIERSLNEI